jgi:hypothetical protein
MADVDSKAVSPFATSSTDCTLESGAGMLTLQPGATCHINLQFTAYATAADDGYLIAAWKVDHGDVMLTAYSQAAALSVSSASVEFGTVFRGGLQLPRFLYLSNNSTAVYPHAAVVLPGTSPFTITDHCPAELAPASVCQIRIDYAAPAAPSSDSAVLSLDQNLTVSVTGSTLPKPTAGGSSANPSLAVSTTSVVFATPVVVTAVSSTTESLGITNTGASPFTLTLGITGDFAFTTSCGAVLAAQATCAVAITFAPSTAGARAGLLSVTAGSGTAPLYVSLSGTGVALLSAGNGSIDLGSVTVGEPVVQFVKVAQSFASLSLTTTGPYTVALVEDTGFGHGNTPPSAYSASVTSACRDCYLGIRFLPTAAGPQLGSLAISSTQLGSPYSLVLNGTGLPVNGLLITSATGDFGSVPVDSSSSPIVFTVTNLLASGTATTLGTATLGGDFQLVGGPAANLPCGGSLNYGASCLIAAEFSPSALGARSATLTIGGPGGTATANLTGFGTADSGIALNPNALSFSNVPGITATVQSVLVTNTGPVAVQISSISTATSFFKATSTCGNLAPKQTCAIQVTFTPGPALLTDSLSFGVTSAGQQTTYSVLLTGGYTAANAGLTITPSEAPFGPAGTSAAGPTRTFTVTNFTAKTLTLVTNFPRQYLPSGASCASLAANASCAFAATFVPLTNGASSGSIVVQGVPGDGSATLQSISYAEGFGNGSGNLAITGGLITNGAFNFGQVTSGQTVSQAFFLTNAGASGSPSITVRRLSTEPPFSATSNCGSLLQATESCQVIVTYSPLGQTSSEPGSPASSTDTGALAIESDAISSTDLLNLTGQAQGATGGPAPLTVYTLSESALTFAATTIGDVSPAQTITLTNTGNVSLHVSSAKVPVDFTVQTNCATVLPGANCLVNVAATPQSPGNRFGALEIASSASDALEFVSLGTTGLPAPLSLSPEALDFGSVLVGQSAILAVQVTNNSSTPATITSIVSSADYLLGGSCLALVNNGSLAPNATCVIAITFSPGTAGVFPTTLSLSSSATKLPLMVSLTGIGLAARLTANPSSLNFGPILIGAPAQMFVTIQNTGSAPVNNLATAISGDFAVTLPCPASLAAGASCILQVTFTPAAIGVRDGSLSLSSSDPAPPLIIPLTGAGINAGSFTLAVNGGASASATVVSGQPASYGLTLTAVGGFSGAVALTCTPVNPAQYATCSFSPASINLNGLVAEGTVTLNTITSSSASANAVGDGATLSTEDDMTRRALCVMLPGLIALWRRRRTIRRRLPVLTALLLTTTALVLSGCSGNVGDPAILYSPPGTYHYLVTASSTSGNPASQTVTLNLTITAR